MPKTADMIVAVTHSDEVNIVACLVAHSLFGVNEKIARLRHQSYLNSAWAALVQPRPHADRPDHLARDRGRPRYRAQICRCRAPSTCCFSATDALRVIAVRCEEGCPIVNTPLRQLTELFPDLNIMVIAISRDARLIVPRGDDQMLDGRRGILSPSIPSMSHAAWPSFGHEEPEAHRVVIIGGGNIGYFLTRELEDQSSGARS